MLLAYPEGACIQKRGTTSGSAGSLLPQWKTPTRLPRCNGRARHTPTLPPVRDLGQPLRDVFAGSCHSPSHRPGPLCLTSETGYFFPSSLLRYTAGLYRIRPVLSSPSAVTFRRTRKPRSWAGCTPRPPQGVCPSSRQRRGCTPARTSARSSPRRP